MQLVIVDDEKLERIALAKMIRMEMPEMEVVAEAVNGRMAIELAKELQPEIMMMDIKMPGIDGVEAVKTIRETNQQIKFIMVSAFNTFEYAKEVMRQGVKEYILKPSKKDDVLAALKRVKDEITAERKNQMEQIHLQENLTRALSTIELEGLSPLLLDQIEDENVDEWNRLLGVAREQATTGQNLPEQAGGNRRQIDPLQQAKEYMEQNFGKNIPLEEVATFTGLSTFHFTKSFKERFGVTFIDYLTDLRIEQAKAEILHTNKSLKEICFNVGYHDPNYFSRVFKKKTGFSPRAYRNQ